MSQCFVHLPFLHLSLLPKAHERTANTILVVLPTHNLFVALPASYTIKLCFDLNRQLHFRQSAYFTFLSLSMSEYFSSPCFIHLQSFHPSWLPWTQQSNHGPPPKRVGSTILMCKNNPSSHLFGSTHSCLFHSSPQNPHYPVQAPPTSHLNRSVNTPLHPNSDIKTL